MLVGAPERTCQSHRVSVRTLARAQEINGMTDLHPASKRLRKPIGRFDVTRKGNDEITGLVSFFVHFICAKVYSLPF